MMYRLSRGARLVLLLSVWLFVTLVGFIGFGRAVAQGPVATPLPINIPTLTPTPVPQITNTPSRTPTLAQIRVEARSKDTGANLRASPSTDAEKLGTIYPGQFLVVTGRWARWIQVQYDKSPTGLAWVYEEVVNITGGDPNTIPTIQPGAVPSPNVATGAAQQTAAFLTATPGAPQTATVIQLSATGVFTRVAIDGTEARTRAGPLPTFTYPSSLIEATLPARVSTTANQGGIPPVVPIIALGIVGLAGLLISGLRRL
jgi:hypothetical protein